MYLNIIQFEFNKNSVATENVAKEKSKTCSIKKKNAFYQCAIFVYIK